MDCIVHRVETMGDFRIACVNKMNKQVGRGARLEDGGYAALSLNSSSSSASSPLSRPAFFRASGEV